MKEEMSKDNKQRRRERYRNWQIKKEKEE